MLLPSPAGLLLALPVLLGGCSDPPDPPATPAPDGLPRWSTAPHVRWAGPTDPVDRPLAVFVDVPAGPADRAAADVDLTTFLNDRFVPVFLVPERAGSLGPAGTLQVLDGDGCWRLLPLSPRDADHAIAGLNAVLRDLAAGTPPVPRAAPPTVPGFPPGHPVHKACPAP